MEKVLTKCIISEEIYTKALQFTNVDVEWGGIGIGSYSLGGEVLLKGIVFPPQIKQTRVYCQFDIKHMALLHFALQDLRLFPQIAIVAWVHSHPGHGIFLSGTDETTFDLFLSESNQRLIALVLEPREKAAGAFKSVSKGENERMPVEVAKHSLGEGEEIKLAILEKILPEMVATIVPPLQAAHSKSVLMEVVDALIEKVNKQQNWLSKG